MPEQHFDLEAGEAVIVGGVRLRVILVPADQVVVSVEDPHQE